MKVLIGFSDETLLPVGRPLSKVLTERHRPAAGKSRTRRAVVTRADFLSAANAAGGRTAGGKRLAPFYDEVTELPPGPAAVIVWPDVLQALRAS